MKTINGNSEEYSIIGIEPFISYFTPKKIASNEWTLSQLTSEQIKRLKENKHSYDLIIGGMKVGLCHFANDVRIDFSKNSTWSYQQSINYGFISAKKDPIFAGKTIDNYDEIIQGHVHFKLLTEDEIVKVRTIRAAGMAYGNAPIDYASYIIIKEKEIGYDVEEVLVPFNRDLMLKSIDESSMPDKDTINKFVSRR